MSYENEIRSIARNMVIQHGTIIEIKGGLNKNPIIQFSDGHILNIQKHSGKVDISIMKYGYGGTGSSLFYAFLNEANFGITYDQVKSMKQGEIIKSFSAALETDGVSKGSELEKKINQLKQKVNDRNYIVRREAARELAEIGDPAIDSLHKDLKEHPLNSYRWKVVEVLGVIGDKMTIEPLIEALSDEDREVRECAANAFYGKLSDGRAREALTKLLDDPHPNVRFHAERALKRLSETKAKNQIITIEENNNIDSKDEMTVSAEPGWVKAFAIASLVISICALPSSFIGCGLFFSVIAVILGLISLVQAKKSDSPRKTRLMALAGTILGGLVIFLHAILIAAEFIW
jgi:hypothetical protein